MTNAQQNNVKNSQKYDLGERTLRFAKDILNVSNKVRENVVNKPLIGQLVRAGTSVGANYSEADEASSKKDFINKLCIAKKEVKETKYWLQLVAHNNPGLKEEARILWREGQELNLILAAIIRKCKENLKGA